jgi:hypothetical protein
MSYKIKQLGPVSEYDTQNGKMKKYTVQFEGSDDWVELSQKPTTPAPTVGQELDGTIEDTQYGKKFKKAYGAGGGFAGGKAQDPATRGSIERQSALKASVEAVSDYYEIVPDPELTLEKYVTKIVNVTNVFAKAIAGADAGPAPAQPSAIPTPAQEPDEKPAEDQINLDDIPF